MPEAVVITGSGSGIGRAIALAFARTQNYRVVVNDNREAAGELVLAEVRQAGGQGRFIPADVSDAGQVQAMFDEIEETCGGVRILVNNAGAPGPFSPITGISDESWHNTMGVHLNGSFFCLRAAARAMAKAGYGRIVNMASIAGLVGTMGSAEYGAAKAAVINLTRTAAKELGPHHITVNAIAPGMVATPANLTLQHRGSRFIDAALGTTPTGRMTEPDEIAGLVLFLCSPAAANITGQVICVDGGAHINIGMDQYMQTYLNRSEQRPQD